FRFLLAVHCLALGSVSGCGQEDPMAPWGAPHGCDVRLDGYCWAQIGLDGDWVGALAQTPWGYFAGTADAGVFRFDSSSSDWMALGLDHAMVSAIQFVPGEPDRLLVGVMPYADEQTEAAVFAAEDAGVTSWIPSDGGLAARNDWRFWAYSLAADPSVPRRVFMGGSAHVLRSDDGGRHWWFSWGEEYLGGLGVNSIVIAPDGSRIWAGGEASIFLGYVLYSNDSGETWEFYAPTPTRDNAVYSLMLDPYMEDRLWAGVQGGVMRSDDGGETWEYSVTEGGLVRALAFLGNRLYAASMAVTGPGDRRPITRMQLHATSDGSQWDGLVLPEGVRGGLCMMVDSLGRLLIGTAGSGVWLVTP
ncbi:MAG: hypothetical protein JSW71_06465, partial [Gemmatimonadota bacterium]